MRSIEITDYDRLIYEEEIRPWLPEQIFDAHAHLIANRFHPRLQESMPLACETMLGEVDCAFLREWWRSLFPQATVAGMVMGFPTVDVAMTQENAYVAEQAQTAGYPFAMMTHPETPVAAMKAEIEALKPSVLKPYLIFAPLADPGLASITDFIPEEQLAVANDYGLAVMLHVSKARGMADTENLETITRLVQDFPKCPFILAHCGRCFIPPNMERALDRLPVAENLWIDTSAVCDLGVFMELLQRYDRSRILFGSDLVTAVGFGGVMSAWA